jgi:hypothetical protein
MVVIDDLGSPSVAVWTTPITSETKSDGTVLPVKQFATKHLTTTDEIL